MSLQTTVREKIKLQGIGLHSGKDITMTLRPAEAGTGIVFHRTDLVPPVSIEAITENVVNTRLSTTIGRDGAVVSTVEHLMAALRCLGIDNLHVDIDGPEVPIMDGSAAPFVAALESAGIRVLSRQRRYLVVRKPVTIVDGDKKVTISPAKQFKVSFELVYNHPVVNSQTGNMNFDEDNFATEYAPARTFGFLFEVETLKANGLARGGSLDNAVVIGDDRILNEEGLRFADEFVRHKILDTVGDLYLAGCPVIGHVKAHKSGHDLNHKLLKELLAKPECWHIEEAADDRFDHHLGTVPAHELVWSEA